MVRWILTVFNVKVIEVERIAVGETTDQAVAVWLSSGITRPYVTHTRNRHVTLANRKIKDSGKNDDDNCLKRPTSVICHL